MKINFDMLSIPKMPISPVNKNAKNTEDMTPTKVNLYSKVCIRNSSNQLQKMRELIKIYEEHQLKQKSFNPQQLTNKLYSIKECNKKNCAQQRQRKKKDQQNNKIQLTNYKKKVSMQIYSQNKTCQKLYNLWLKKQYKYKFQQQTKINQKNNKTAKCLSKMKSVSFLQVGFYERLNKDVCRIKAKNQIIQSNPYIFNSQLFTPDVSASKKSFQRIKKCFPVQQKQPLQNLKQKSKINKKVQHINSRINTSVSQLSKSIELMQQNEQHFFERMSIIFGCNDTYSVNADAIKLLTEVQFQIMLSFISFLEDKHLKKDEFIVFLKQYYKDLQPKDKQKLRSHEIKRRYTKQDIYQQQKTKRKKCNRQISNDYLKKYELFI